MNVCRGSDEIGSDFTAERESYPWGEALFQAGWEAARLHTGKGQCNSDLEDSAYAAGHRDGYNDARSDMTVDPVADDMNDVEMKSLRETVSLSGEWTMVIVNGWVAGYLRDPRDAAAVAERAVRDPSRETATPSIYSR